MSKATFRAAMVTASAQFPNSTISEETILSYESYFQDKHGLDHPWGKIFNEAVEESDFFPSIKSLKSSMARLGILQEKQTTAQIAGALVDEFIGACQTGNAFETLGREKYYLMKNVCKFIPHDLSNGDFDPRFQRAASVRKLEAHLNAEQTPQLEESDSPISFGFLGKDLK